MSSETSSVPRPAPAAAVIQRRSTLDRLLPLWIGTASLPIVHAQESPGVA